MIVIKIANTDVYYWLFNGVDTSKHKYISYSILFIFLPITIRLGKIQDKPYAYIFNGVLKKNFIFSEIGCHNTNYWGNRK